MDRRGNWVERQDILNERQNVLNANGFSFVLLTRSLRARYKSWQTRPDDDIINKMWRFGVCRGSDTCCSAGFSHTRKMTKREFSLLYGRSWCHTQTLTILFRVRDIMLADTPELMFDKSLHRNCTTRKNGQKGQLGWETRYSQWETRCSQRHLHWNHTISKSIASANLRVYREWVFVCAVDEIVTSSLQELTNEAWRWHN